MSNRRASDRARERQSVEAIKHLSAEIAELVDLRGRVAAAEAILASGGDAQQALAVLRGERSW